MSFITDYAELTAGTKPCQEYHIWSMMSVLSTFAGRRFWFPFGYLHFYPNMYVVLVGEPAAGKSSAMKIAKEIVRNSGICPVAATQITKEALTLKMSGTINGAPRKEGKQFEGRKTFMHEGREEEYNQYAIFATELVEFIAVNPQGFLDFLTTVWDESVIEVETKNKGQDYVRGPYITMLACLTPEKLKGYLKFSILTGGFARRAAFMFSAKYNIVDFPEAPPKHLMDRCIEFGRNLQKRSGAFALTPAARQYYIDWNQNNEKTIRDRHMHVRGWFASKAEMLFKMSMLLALANDPEGPLLIDVPHYRLAEKYCAMLEVNLHRVFEGTGINPNAGAISQVVAMLESLGRPMNRKHLEVMFMDSATSLGELRDTLTHLVQAGRLAERNVVINGQLRGTVIGMPETINQHSDSDLARFLLVVAVPPKGPELDSTEAMNQVAELPMPRSQEEQEDQEPDSHSPLPPAEHQTVVPVAESPQCPHLDLRGQEGLES